MKVPKQPELNIGMVGHVDHGKTTLTKALTGEWTDRHSEEMKRGISIKLGYADAVFYRCPKCAEPECYTTKPRCKHCGTATKFLRAVSFVDAPGHETLMATMLSGAAIMNGALLLIAANEPCPQPQTKEHLMALEITGVKNIVIVQNKIDIVSETVAEQNYHQILRFIGKTFAKHTPIIPVSAHHDINIDALIQSIEQNIPTPSFEPTLPARMYVARSFDVNKPGEKPSELKGGVIGGTLMHGKLKVGDEIEIAPWSKGMSQTKKSASMITEIVSIYSGGNSLKEVGSGGLLAVGTLLDPVFTKADRLIGCVAGKPGTLPPVIESFSMEPHLLESVVGSADELRVEPIKTNEALMLNIGTATTVGVVKRIAHDICEVNLKLQVCAEPGQRVAISRKVAGKWRLIGYGIIK